MISFCRNAWTPCNKSPRETASRSSFARKGTTRRKPSPTEHSKYLKPLTVCKEFSPLSLCNCCLFTSRFCAVAMSIVRETWPSRSQSSKIERLGSRLDQLSLTNASRDECIRQSRNSPENEKDHGNRKGGKKIIIGVCRAAYVPRIRQTALVFSVF